MLKLALAFIKVCEIALVTALYYSSKYTPSRDERHVIDIPITWPPPPSRGHTQTI